MVELALSFGSAKILIVGTSIRYRQMKKDMPVKTTGRPKPGAYLGIRREPIKRLQSMRQTEITCFAASVPAANNQCILYPGAMKLSALIITKNEANNILQTRLDSARFANEWIIVDSGSTDGTVEIARTADATVIETADWPGFGLQKNCALDAARKNSPAKTDPNPAQVRSVQSDDQ